MQRFPPHPSLCFSRTFNYRMPLFLELSALFAASLFTKLATNAELMSPEYLWARGAFVFFFFSFQKANHTSGVSSTLLKRKR